MPKKAIISVLCVTFAVIVASLTLVLTLGPKVNADDTVGVLDKAEYFNISGTTLNGLSSAGTTYGNQFSKYEVVIPDGVTALAYTAFNKDKKIVGVTIPASVTSFGYNRNRGYGTFNDCTNLATVNYLGTIDQWVQINFYEYNVNPVFYAKKLMINGEEISDVVISDGVTSIGNNVFYYCKSLTSITIPDSVTTIGRAAFVSCSNLTSVEMPNTIENISDSLFMGCKSLTSITIPDSVTSIGTFAFANSGLTSITIPGSVTSFGEGLFKESSLNSVTLTEGLICISEGMFESCKSLTSITIPDSVTSVEAYAFANSGLTSITIPDSVFFVAGGVFYGWNGARTVYCECSEEYANEHWNSGWRYGCMANVVWNYGGPEYTVTFDSKGGSAVTSQAVSSVATEPDAPTREGYDFQYWYTTDENVPYDFDTEVTGDLTLNAKWEPKEYTVEFDTMGGTQIANQTVAYGQCIPAVTTTLEGYDFQYWYTTNENTAFNVTTLITADITLHAKWKVKQYTITYNSDGGSAVASKTVDYNTVVNAPANPTREGYNFEYWYTANQDTAFNFSTPITQDITLIAKWQIQIFAVTFMVEGSSFDTKQVEYNKTVTAPEAPTKNGYNFIGWYTEGNELFDLTTPITQSVTLHAEYSETKCVVTFVLDGNVIDSQELNVNGKATAPELQAVEGYNFIGWCTDEECTQNYDMNTEVTGNLTLYAQWQIKRYTVKFDINGVESTQTVEHGSIAEAPSLPTVEGFTFIGWYTESNKLFDAENTPITSNINLHAVWGLNNFIVKFMVNGTVFESQNINSNGKVQQPQNPTQAGYTFEGWYTDDQFTNIYDFDQPVTRNLTLYGKLRTASTNNLTTPDENNIDKGKGSKENLFMIAWMIIGIVVAIVGSLSTILAIIIIKKHSKKQ